MVTGVSWMNMATFVSRKLPKYLGELLYSVDILIKKIVYIGNLQLFSAQYVF